MRKAVSFLLGATDDWSESAAPSSRRWPPNRSISRRAKLSLGALALLFAVVGATLWSPSTVSDSTIPSEEIVGQDVQVPGSASPSIAPLPTTTMPRATRTYAVAAHELAGLPPDATPGTRLELWVAWDPPISETANIQRLAHGITLEKMIQPVTPDGPVTALLRVPVKAIGDLLYGDRYGSLSVTVLPQI